MVSQERGEEQHRSSSSILYHTKPCFDALIHSASYFKREMVSCMEKRRTGMMSENVFVLQEGYDLQPMFYLIVREPQQKL